MDEMIIFKTYDRVIAQMISNALNDNHISHTITGLANIGLPSEYLEIEIRVSSQDDVDAAKNIVEQFQ